MQMAVVFRVYAASGRMWAGPERFALGDFLMQALNGQQLQIKAGHRVVRSYGHVGMPNAIELGTAETAQAKRLLWSGCLW